MKVDFFAHDPAEIIVRTSHDEVVRWDRSRISDVLVVEAKLDRNIADEIALEVEGAIFRSGISVITSQLVREMTDIRLTERGLEKAKRLHSRVGIPLYDLDKAITDADIPSPEHSDRIISGRLKRDYALSAIFPDDVSDAHLRAIMHISGIRYIDRIAGFSLPLSVAKEWMFNIGKIPVRRVASGPELFKENLLSIHTNCSNVVSDNITWTGASEIATNYAIPENEFRKSVSDIFEAIGSRIVIKDNDTVCTDRPTLFELGETSIAYGIVLQQVDINCARLGYESAGRDDVLFSKLASICELACSAHKQKRFFIERLLSRGCAGTLSLLTRKLGERPLFRLNESVCHLRLVGITEMCELHAGRTDGVEMTAMKRQVKSNVEAILSKLSRKHGIALQIASSGSPTACRRFAMADLRLYPSRAGRTVKGSIEKADVYYSCDDSQR